MNGLPDHDWIRGLSIKQPWASCILAGTKTIENRPRTWFMFGLGSEHSL